MGITNETKIILWEGLLAFSVAYCSLNYLKFNPCCTRNGTVNLLVASSNLAPRVFSSLVSFFLVIEINLRILFSTVTNRLRDL